MEITEIKRKNHSKNVYQIWLDNMFWAEMLDESVVKFALKVGKTLDQEDLDDVFEKSRTPLAFHLAISLLERSIKTEKELKKYLFEKGFLEHHTLPVLAKLKGYGYINDQKFAENFLLSHKNKGKKALRFELKMHGVDEQIIADVLKKLGSQEHTIVLLAQKFLRQKHGQPKIREKLFRHLASKGFDFEEINSVMSKILEEEHESWN